MKDAKISLLEQTVKQLRAQLDNKDDILDDLQEAFETHQNHFQQNLQMASDALGYGQSPEVSIGEIEDELLQAEAFEE